MLTYPKETRIAIKDAVTRAKKTKTDKTLLMLASDGDVNGWVSARALALKVSHRFGAYIFNLRQDGVAIEMRLDPLRMKGERWYQYRLAFDEQEALCQTKQ